MRNAETILNIIHVNGQCVAGEPDAMKVARPVRRGTDGKVPLGNSPAVYPTMLTDSMISQSASRLPTWIGDTLAVRSG